MATGGAAIRSIAGFSPLALPLSYLLHPDDATDIVSGEVNSLVDRKAGATFTAPASGNRMPLDINNERPGHNAVQDVAGADWLRHTGALADSLAGNTDCTGFCFWRPTNFASGLSMIQHTSGGAAGAVRFDSNSGSGNGYRMGRRDPSFNHQFSVATARSTVWQFVLWTYTASTRTFESFIDNVSKGTVAFSDDISPGSMTTIDWGLAVGYYSVSGAMPRLPTEVERTNLYNWTLANA